MRIAFLFALAVALSGCFGGDDAPAADSGSGETQTFTGTTSPSVPTSDPAGPTTWNITIKGNDFVEGSLTIRVGDTVRWIHADGTTPHTVTADDGSFDSGTTAVDYMTAFRNTEFEYTFTAAGDFPYHCAVHQSMTDAITVVL